MCWDETFWIEKWTGDILCCVAGVGGESIFLIAVHILPRGWWESLPWQCSMISLAMIELYNNTLLVLSKT